MVVQWLAWTQQGPAGLKDSRLYRSSREGPYTHMAVTESDSTPTPKPTTGRRNVTTCLGYMSRDSLWEGQSQSGGVDARKYAVLYTKNK